MVRSVAALDLPAYPFDIADGRMTWLVPVLVQPVEVSGEVDADNKRTGIGNGGPDLGCRLRPPLSIRKQHDEASRLSLWIEDMHIAKVSAVEGIDWLKRENLDGGRDAKGDGFA